MTLDPLLRKSLIPFFILSAWALFAQPVDRQQQNGGGPGLPGQNPAQNNPLPVLPPKTQALDLHEERPQASPAVASFNVRFTYRIVSRKDNKDLWVKVLDKVLPVGSTLSIRSSRNDIVILTYFTPLQSTDGHIILKAMSRVWQQGEDGRLSYFSSVNTIPITVSEEAVFYPLGISPGEANVFEIKVLFRDADQE
jgi:hypothetical protein